MNEAAVLYRMGLDGACRCRRIYGDDHAMDAGMKKSAESGSSHSQRTRKTYHRDCITNERGKSR